MFDFVMWISSVIRHGDLNKQDYVDCMNVSKEGRYPACVGAFAQVYMPVCNVVFCDRKMLSCGSALNVCDWLD